MTDVKSPRDLILKILSERSVTKQDVFKNTKEAFQGFKDVLKNIAGEISRKIADVDKRLVIEYTDTSEFEVKLRVAGDVLVFYMHTNIFSFDKAHSVWNTSYVKGNELNSYCGCIYVYNFLNDSFKYDRLRDSGYLIARVFVNRDMHYFVEGKRQLGFLYNDFVNAVLTPKDIHNIIESAIIYSMDFDLLVPNYGEVSEISVHEMKEALSVAQLKTAKRLGFRFDADNDVAY